MLESITNREMEYQKLSPEEMQKRGILGRLIGTIADFTNPTRNGRLYSEELWDKAFDSPIMKEKIENRCCLGELGHPTDRSETDIEKVAICLAEVPKKNKGVLQGVFDILDTPNGRILKTLCDYGCKIGVSSRGEGDTYVDFDGQESVDPNTYSLECWDAVLIPAVQAARPTYVTESLQKPALSLTESLNKLVEESSDEDRKVMKETLSNLNLNEGYQYKDYNITVTQSGASLRDKGGKFIKEFPTEKEAEEYVDSLNESLNEEDVAVKVREKQDPKEMTRKAIKMLKNLGGEWKDLAKEFKDTYGEDAINEGIEQKESSGEDVDIDVTLEKDEGVADPSDILEQLQASLLENKRLTDTISKLQEKVSVCNAKDEKNESIILKQKQSINKLTESVKSSLALRKEIISLNKLNEDLKNQLSQCNKEINRLNESISRIKSEKISLNKSKSLYEKEISKEVSKLQESIKSYKLNENKYVDTIEGLKKDLLQKQNEYKLKLNQKEKLVEQYKRKSAFIVDKYIELQASTLGIESSDIKNRLNENYSFKDIDKICEEYKSYTVNMNSLPFDASVNMKVKNPFKQNLVPIAEDEIDDQLLRMSGLK